VEIEHRRGVEAGQPVDIITEKQTSHEANSAISSPALQQVATAAVDATPWGGLLGGVGALSGLALAWVKSKQAKDESDYSGNKDEELRRTQEKLNKALAHLPEAKAKEVIE
jgi:hypothetical protein